jgi:hypothetical protein
LRILRIVYASVDMTDMAITNNIPIHVIAPYMANDDLTSFQNCLILNKEFNTYASERTLKFVKTVFHARHPLFWKCIKRCISKIEDFKGINIKVLLHILDALKVIKSRNKGDRYQHLLKPLLDRSIFTEYAFSKDQDVDVTLHTMNIIVALIEYAKEFEADNLSPKKWVVYAFVDYGFHGIMELSEHNYLFAQPGIFRQVLTYAVSQDFKYMPRGLRLRFGMLIEVIKLSLMNLSMTRA